MQPAPSDPLSPPRMARFALAAFLVVQTAFALADPDAFPYLGPLLVLAHVFAIAIVITIMVVARDVRAVLHHRTRLLHGLEHATIAVLQERGMPVRSGVTHEGSFILVFDHERRIWERVDEIEAAARDAIRRVIAGEHALAYTPRCGTSYLVGFCVYGLAIVAAGITALAVGAPVGIAWAITVGAGLTAAAVARPAGLAVQRWLTVSSDLASATVTDLDRRAMSGDRVVVTLFVDVEPRPREGGLVSPGVLG